MLPFPYKDSLCIVFPYHFYKYRMYFPRKSLQTFTVYFKVWYLANVLYFQPNFPEWATSITAMGCRQCLPQSVFKHCQKLHCRNGRKQNYTSVFVSQKQPAEILFFLNTYKPPNSKILPFHIFGYVLIVRRFICQWMGCKICFWLSKCMLNLDFHIFGKNTN